MHEARRLLKAAALVALQDPAISRGDQLIVLLLKFYKNHNKIILLI